MIGLCKSAGIAAGLLIIAGLAGCLTHKSKAPLPSHTRQNLAAAGIQVGAPLYIRVFKQERAMELWLKGRSGSYQLFRTYEVCRYSGKLGPKLKEGDKQAPEGFYVVTARQMNPNSRRYLSFNLGFPNAYDRAHGRTGTHLMVHGGCTSSGCYAITDEAVKEVYILAREAFAKGQRRFPVHAFPFRMTAANMAAHQNSRWIGFWRNLKQGHDHFELTGQPPVAGVEDRRYVFFGSETAIPAGVQMRVLAGDPGGLKLIRGWQK